MYCRHPYSLGEILNKMKKNIREICGMLVPILGRTSDPSPMSFPSLTCENYHTLIEIVNLIPKEYLLKMNIDMPIPFWHD